MHAAHSTKLSAAVCQHERHSPPAHQPTCVPPCFGGRAAAAAATLQDRCSDSDLVMIGMFGSAQLLLAQG